VGREVQPAREDNSEVILEALQGLAALPYPVEVAADSAVVVVLAAEAEVAAVVASVAVVEEANKGVADKRPETSLATDGGGNKPFTDKPRSLCRTLLSTRNRFLSTDLISRKPATRRAALV
jgi:hypothetical protein